MFQFDPKKEREILAGGGAGSCHYYLTLDFRKYQQLRALAGGGTPMLIAGIYCWLVGLDSEGRAVLERAAEWLKAAINNNEDGFSVGGRRGIHESLALTQWLLSGHNDSANLQRSVAYEEEDDFNPKLARGKKLDSLALDVYLAVCLQAGLCERGLTMLRKAGEDISAILPAKASSPRKVAAVLCRDQAAPGNFTKEAMAAAHRLLRRHVPDWLGRGHAKYVATWLKILYWTPHPSLSPRDVILKAYDYLPAELRVKAGI